MEQEEERQEEQEGGWMMWRDMQTGTREERWREKYEEEGHQGMCGAWHGAYEARLVDGSGRWGILCVRDCASPLFGHRMFCCCSWWW